MSAPRRMNAPRRMDAAPAPPMFPHTITLYNISVETDRDTLNDTVTNHITILKGVLVDASKAVNVRESGLVSADAVDLYIPFDVEAVDAVTGGEKGYLPPVEFWRSEDMASHWTLAVSAKGATLNGYTFFIKGAALPPEGTAPEKVREVVEAMYDDVYNITKIDTKDTGGLQHWEVGAN